ncbi:MAG: adhesin, partial [Rickettsia endosymbiont of Pentastiridius leporinus]
MKKLLLIAASTAILSSSVSFADCDMSATTDSTMLSSADQW